MYCNLDNNKNTGLSQGLYNTIRKKVGASLSSLFNLGKLRVILSNKILKRCFKIYVIFQQYFYHCDKLHLEYKAIPDITSPF